MNRVCFTVATAALLVFWDAGPALAGPPYQTDDPQPPAPGEWEVISFASGNHLSHATEAEAGFDINYGFSENIQLAAAVALGYDHTAQTRTGAADLELGVKYRFARQHEDGRGVDVAFYPSMTLPTGRSGFSEGHVTAFLPLWAQKDIGPWSLFGGGGYTLNPGTGSKDFWRTGIAVTREVAPHLIVGGEAYHDGASEVGGHSTNGLGVGVEIELSDHLALVGSGGPMLTHRAETGRYAFFFGVVATR